MTLSLEEPVKTASLIAMGIQVRMPETPESCPGAEQVRQIALFRDLEDTEVEQIRKGLKCIKLLRGEYLYRQGREADSAFFVASGSLDIVSALPGGGDIRLATVGPGDTVGETSLVAEGIRTASVLAKTDVTGYTMERLFFQGSCAQVNPVASKIVRCITAIVSDRLRLQYTTLTGSNLQTAHEFPGHQAVPTLPANGNATAATLACPENLQPYLQKLGFFAGFQSQEVRRLESMAVVSCLPAGNVLFQENAAADRCYFVVRGALERYYCRDEGRIPLAVFGPGAFLGTAEIISNERHIACSRVREDAILFEINAHTLLELLSGQSRFAQKFQLALCESLVLDLGKINKRVARTTTQEYIFTA